MDTVEANNHLGFDDDLRDYSVAAEMLHILGVESIELLTNNPKKISGLRENGIKISERKPIRILANPFNSHYLNVKKNKSGHIL